MIPDDAIRHGESASQAEHLDSRDILKIVGKHGNRRAALISILGDIQTKYRYLPQDSLKIVSDGTGCSPVDVYAAATFYRSFSLKPKGKHVVSVCLGTACHVRGAPSVADQFQQQLGIGPGETTPDKQFTLETVNCLGACALGPIVTVDGHYFSKVTAAQVPGILEKSLAGLDDLDIERDERIFPVVVSCPHCHHSLMDTDYLLHGSPSIRLTASFGPTRGWARLCSLYGICTARLEHEVPMNTSLDFFCPHCHTRLSGTERCLECEAQMLQMAVDGGGKLMICPRYGCSGHLLDLDGAGTGDENDSPAKPIGEGSSRRG